MEKSPPHGARRSFPCQGLYAFQGEFKWFNSDGERDLKRHGRFRDKLADIIVEHIDAAISFMSLISVGAKGVRQSYEDAALRGLYNFTKGRTGKRDSLCIVLARHPELSPWSILNKFEMIDWEQKLAGCAILSPHDVLPLQAADFALHSLNKRWGGLELSHS